MSLILALDASGSACSVALWYQEQVLSQLQPQGNQHTQVLLPMVQDLLAQAGVSLQQLDAIAYGQGPGSFTGIRIAAGAAQGLAFGLDCPLLPVSTLAALALQAAQQVQVDYYYCGLDARMGEIYWGCYRVDHGAVKLVTLCDTELVCKPTAVVANKLPAAASYMGCGSAWQFELPKELCKGTVTVQSELFPRAQEIALIAQVNWLSGGGKAPEHALPVYLRNAVAWQKLPRYRKV